MTVKSRLGWVGVSLVVLMAAACDGNTDTDTDTDTEGPCDGVTCSGNGDCVEVGDEAECDCDDGYRPDGLDCIVDPCYEIDCSDHGDCVDNAGTAEFDCSGHGDCIDLGSTAECDCDDGYKPDGLDCIVDPCYQVDCSGHGGCIDDDGEAWCVCDTGWDGDDCDTCGPSYEPEAGGCIAVAEYMIKDLDGDGRYTHRPTHPWPSHVHDDVWMVGEDSFPFRSVDSALRMESSEDYQWEVFTSGNQYILYKGDGWVSCLNEECTSTSPDPGTLGDDYWGDFPFTDGIDAMTMTEVSDPLFVFTRGSKYALWDTTNEYHHRDPGPETTPLAGDIGDDWWGAGFPFTTIDAMVDYDDGSERILFVSGTQAVTCTGAPTALVCGTPFDVGSAGDSFFPYRWQILPFAQVDTLIRSGDGEELFIISNTPLARTRTRSQLHTLESLEGPPQRSLVLSGSPYDQGFDHGYLLGEEILGVINEVNITFYNDHITEEVTLAGGETGYQAARALTTLFDYSGEFAVYLEELEGMVDGIEANPLTNGLVFDDTYEEPIDLADIMALQLVDDLWGTACKSAAIWPEGATPVDGVYHLSMIDWIWGLGPYNLIVAYDNESDPQRMSWKCTSWSGNTGGFMIGVNEIGGVYSYVSSGGELRSCPSEVEDCIDTRLAMVSGLTLHSNAFVTRRVIERATDVDDAYAMLGGEETMAVSGFTGSSPPQSVATPGAVFEYVYPGIQTFWSDEYNFFDDDVYPNSEMRLAADDPNVDGKPILVSTAHMVKIYEPEEGDKWGPVYVALRDELVDAYEDETIDADTIVSIIETHTNPLIYIPESTIQLTVAEPSVGMFGNESVIEVLFATGEAKDVFEDNASRGRHTWAEVFFGQSTR
jgi:hypothetical protein